MPGVVGGEPVIEGTRLPVQTIVLYHREYQDLDDLQRVYPVLDRSLIQEALTFYAANRAEIDGSIAEDDEELEG